MKKLALVCLSFVLPAIYGQAANPASTGPGGIAWPRATGAGAPSTSCTSANYGQPYTNTTANTQYVCSTSGWVLLGAGGSFTAAGDLSGSSASQTVIGLKGTAFCTGFTPTNGQFIELTTGGSPNPCWTAVAGTGGGPNNFPGTTHQFVTSYDSTSHNFTSAQPVEGDVVNLTSDLALKAPLASPALTGTPTVPTAAPGTNTTQAASTAYVQSNAVIAANYGGIDTFGDSLCQGTGAYTFMSFGVQATGYCQTLISDFGGQGQNYGLGGDQVADMSIKVLANTNPTVSNNFITNMLASTNDVNTYGANTDKQNIFLRSHTHAIGWPALPDASKTMAASSLCARTGTWAADGAKIYSVTNGSTLTCSVTVPSGVSAIYYGYEVSDSYTSGTALITIDGSSPANDATVISTGQAGAAISTANGATVTFFAARYTVSPGTHTFVITVSGSGVVEPVWLGSPAAANPAIVAPPLVLVGGTPWNQGDSPSTLTATYDTIIKNLVASMRADGAPVYFVDIRNGTNTRNSTTFTPLNSTTDYAGGVQGTLVCPASAFLPLHPNSYTSGSRACGHGHLAAAFEAAIGIKAQGPTGTQIAYGAMYPDSAAQSRLPYTLGPQVLSLNGRIDHGAYIGLSSGQTGDPNLHLQSPSSTGGFSFDVSNAPPPGTTPTITNIGKGDTTGLYWNGIESITYPGVISGTTGQGVGRLFAPNLAAGTNSLSLSAGVNNTSDYSFSTFSYYYFGGANSNQNYMYSGMGGLSPTFTPAPGYCSDGLGHSAVAFSPAVLLSRCGSASATLVVEANGATGTNGYGIYSNPTTGATNNYAYGSNGFSVDVTGNLAAAASSTVGGSPICTTANGACTGTGNTTSTALTTNKLPKANGANSIIDSSISDNGTAVSTPEPFSAPSISTGSGSAACGTATGCFAAAEASTAGSPTAANDYCRADSVTHKWACSMNAGGELISLMNFATVNLASTAAGGVAGLLPVANGGTGTSTPGIVAGSNITVSGTWPNQTVNAAAAGTGISGGTANFIPKFGTATTITANSALDDGVTTASTLTSTEPITVNLSGHALPTMPTNTVDIVANVNASSTRRVSSSYGATSFFSVLRANGTSTSPTQVLSGEQVGGINAWAWNNSAAYNGPIASLRYFANENQTAAAAGSYADIATTPNGSTTLTQVLKFENDGGMTTPAVTGGDKGPGTLNAHGIYIDGVAVGTGGVNVTTKGDLQGFSTVAARIPVGSNNQVLTADSTQALGLKWATPTSGTPPNLLCSQGSVMAPGSYPASTTTYYGCGTQGTTELTSAKMVLGAGTVGCSIYFNIYTTTTGTGSIGLQFRKAPGGSGTPTFTTFGSSSSIPVGTTAQVFVYTVTGATAAGDLIDVAITPGSVTFAANSISQGSMVCQ